MSIFEIEVDNTPQATNLAKGFLAEANQQFENQLNGVYDAVQRFWYRNRDAEGNPALEGDEPTGVEILQAMGTKAQSVIAVAYARVVMLMTIQQSLGLSGLVDLQRASAPYDLVFNPDGSLLSATLKQ